MALAEPASGTGRQRKKEAVITSYHRPPSLAEALDLISSPDAVVVAGGTELNARPPTGPVAAVDLQALELSGFEASGSHIHIGATTTLRDIMDADDIPPVLRDLARREAPNTIRNAATIGGTIAAGDADSQFLTGLLAFGATISVARQNGAVEISVDELLDDLSILDAAIITSVTVPTGGSAAADRTGRTPMDVPIVSAVAHLGADGTETLALSGIAATPLVVSPDDLGELEPRADFRGSSEYRAHLGSVLSDRVLASIRGEV